MSDTPRTEAELVLAIVDEAFPTGGTEGPNAWTDERIRVRTRFAEAVERILAEREATALDVERLIAAADELSESLLPYGTQGRYYTTPEPVFALRRALGDARLSEPSKEPRP